MAARAIATLKMSRKIKNLITFAQSVATTYYFRSQSLTPKGGESDWGQAVSLLVK
jgi:hypothetical protein